MAANTDQACLKVAALLLVAGVASLADVSRTQASVVSTFAGAPPEGMSSTTSSWSTRARIGDAQNDGRWEAAVFERVDDVMSIAHDTDDVPWQSGQPVDFTLSVDRTGVSFTLATDSFVRNVIWFTTPDSFNGVRMTLHDEDELMPGEDLVNRVSVSNVQLVTPGFTGDLAAFTLTADNSNHSVTFFRTDLASIQEFTLTGQVTFDFNDAATRTDAERSKVSFAGVTVVPTPGTIPLLGATLLLASRRRRA
ncbi:MAG: choice-of-anchor W domain-containing protein [Planctomycetota bacterium]|nr:choice-of-anchor W domain-containing protein [Planctomycetota bacterium]